MDLKNFNLAPLYAIDQEWAILTAGKKEKFNAMTISWGGLGTIWNKPVVTVYVKPIRYTYEFMESNEYFTISFYDKKYREDLAILGSKSGRDLNKVELTKLTPDFLKNTTSFKEAKLTIVCKKIYFQDLDINNIDINSIPRSEVDRFYKTEPAHRMYIGEVVDIIDRRF
ncbi:MAG: flavin reductase [Clostridia bacterium]